MFLKGISAPFKGPRADWPLKGISAPFKGPTADWPLKGISYNINGLNTDELLKGLNSNIPLKGICTHQSFKQFSSTRPLKAKGLNSDMPLKELSHDWLLGEKFIDGFLHRSKPTECSNLNARRLLKPVTGHSSDIPLNCMIPYTKLNPQSINLFGSSFTHPNFSMFLRSFHRSSAMWSKDSTGTPVDECLGGSNHVDDLNSADNYKEEEEGTILTHVDSKGKANMVDVGHKVPTLRKAKAQGTIILGEKAFKLLISNKMSKGDVLTVSEIAGIMGTKKTSELIPLCHPLNINKIKVRIELDEIRNCAVVECEVSCSGQTGVEMEALTGVSVTLLTLYDMCKAVTKDMIIQDVRLLQKTGGKSDYKKS